MFVLASPIVTLGIFAASNPRLEALLASDEVAALRGPEKSECFGWTTSCGRRPVHRLTPIPTDRRGRFGCERSRWPCHRRRGGCEVLDAGTPERRVQDRQEQP